MKRVLLFVALVTIVATFGFANGSGETAGSGGTPTISVMTHEGYGLRIKPSSDMKIYAEAQRLLGVKIDWQTAPTDTMREAVSTRFAAGKDLPDVVNMVNMSITDIVPLYDSGLIVPITDDMIAKYAPELGKFFAQNPDAKTANMSPDGKLLGVPDSITYTKDWQPQLQINQPWMKYLGLADPTTTDQFYTMLKAFKTGDPNKNGKADEIPFAQLWNSLDYFATGWDLTLEGNSGSVGYSVGKDGKIADDYIAPRMKDYFAYMHKLYTEGLLDKDFPNNSMDMMAKKVSTNLIGSFAEWSSFSGQYDKLVNPNYTEEGPTWRDESQTVYKIIAQPKAAPQYSAQRYLRYASLGTWVITKDSKQPGADLHFLSALLLDPKLVDLLTWGIKGETYDIKDGKHVMLIPMTDFGKMGGSEWALPNHQSGWDDKSGPKTVSDVRAGRPNTTRLPFPRVAITADESDKLKQYGTDVSTYFAEERIKFITGDEDLSNFDNYVAEMKKRGADELLKIYQAQYDRFVALSGKK